VRHKAAINKIKAYVKIYNMVFKNYKGDAKKIERFNVVTDKHQQVHLHSLQPSMYDREFPLVLRDT
jgi:hypothetical protein